LLKHPNVGVSPRKHDLSYCRWRERCMIHAADIT
jgi:hypothetical protein